jgi:putative membrane protein insertion efficiency factor
MAGHASEKGTLEPCPLCPAEARPDVAIVPALPSSPGGIRGWPRLFGRGLIKVYRYTLSPLIGFHCRHLPTCSDYGDQAIGRFGLWAGGWMTLARLLRCQPWGTSGLDFVADALPVGARWYMPWRYGRWRGINANPGQDPGRPR